MDDWKATGMQFSLSDLNDLGQAKTVASEYNERLLQVEGLISQHVTECYEDLIFQSTGIRKAEDTLNAIENKTTSLSLAIHRVVSKLDDSYERTHNKVVQLENMQRTCDLLRKVTRVLFIEKRLEQQLEAGDRDLAKAAQSAWQLDQLFSQCPELSKITVCQPALKLVREATAKIKQRSTDLLQSSLQKENHNVFGNAIQVFYQLNELHGCVKGIIEDMKKTLRSEIARLLSINQLNKSQASKGFGPGKANMPVTGNSALLRSNFWSNTESILNLCVTSIQKFHFIISLLAKKKDSSTNYVSFLQLVREADDDDESSDVVSIVSYFTFVQNSLKIEYSKCASSSSSLKQIVDSEYPKLLKSFLTLRDRVGTYLDLESSNDAIIAGEFEGGDVSVAQQMKLIQTVSSGWKKCLEDFQSAHLSRSVSRLFDIVQLAFSSSSSTANKNTERAAATKLPTVEETNAIINAISTELTVVLFDLDLMELVCRNVVKAINLFAIKIEEIVPNSVPECWQLLGPVNSTQEFMISIANHVYSFKNDLETALSKLSMSKTCLAVLQPALDKLESTVCQIIKTWMDKAEKYIKDIIKTMHQENVVNEAQNKVKKFGSLSSDEHNKSASLYIKELSSFTERVSTSYLSKFNCDSCLDSVMNELFISATDFFMLHVAIMMGAQEIGPENYVIIENDVEMFEQSLKILKPGTSFSFKGLRLFKSALKSSPEELIDLVKSSDLVRMSSLILLLFSKACPSIAPVHVISNMDIADVSKWFAEHPTEKDRVAFLGSALEVYVQNIRNEGLKEYSVYYPHLRTMLEQAFDRFSQSQKT